jgi:uridine nucleosidase
MYAPMLQAIQKDPNFAKNVKQLVVLGGAFNGSGNVNPAAEANVSLKGKSLIPEM